MIYLPLLLCMATVSCVLSCRVKCFQHCCCVILHPDYQCYWPINLYCSAGYLWRTSQGRQGFNWRPVNDSDRCLDLISSWGLLFISIELLNSQNFGDYVVLPLSAINHLPCQFQGVVNFHLGKWKLALGESIKNFSKDLVFSQATGGGWLVV